MRMHCILDDKRGCLSATQQGLSRSSIVLRVFCIIALFLMVRPAFADIVLMDYAKVKEQTDRLEDFENSFPRHRIAPDIPHGNVLQFDGISFGERFEGQTMGNLSSARWRGNWDTLIGRPTDPLTLVPASRSENLALATGSCLESTVLNGIGAGGYGEKSSRAEGAVSVEFNIGQRAFGFRVGAYTKCLDADPSYRIGRVLVQTFDATGRPLGARNIQLTGRDTWIAVGTSDGSPSIYGVSLTNTDAGGVNYDDFIYALDTIIVAGLSVPRRQRAHAQSNH